MKYFLLMLGLILLNLPTNAQQILSDQFIGSPIMVNPAACGQYSGYTITSGYRRQWAGLENAPSSFNAIIEYKFPGSDAKSRLDANKGLPLMGKWAIVKPPKIKSGKRKIRHILPPDSVRLFYAAGLRLQTENIGFINRVKVGLLFSSHINLYNNRFLALGGNVGIQSTQLNLDNAILEDPTELSQIGTSAGVALNMGLGAYYYSPSIIAGVSLMDIGANNQSFFSRETGAPTSYPFTLFGTFGYIRKLSSSIELIPAATMRYSTGYNSAIIDFTAKALFSEKFMAGAGYRSSGAPLVFLGYLLDERYSFNYCYGLQPNDALGEARSSHEIMFSMNLQNKVSRLVPVNYRWR